MTPRAEEYPSVGATLDGLSFRIKLGLTISASLLGIALVTSLASSYVHYEALNRSIKTRLSSVAEVCAELIDPRLHERLRTAKDMQDPEYLRLIHRLNAILRTEPGLKYIYTMRPADGTPTSHDFTFVLDGGSAAHPPGASSPDFSGIGSRYTTLPDWAKRVLITGKPAVDDAPVLDKWGWTLSGYAPLFNDQGRPIAVVGVDMSADELAHAMSDVYRVSAMMFAFALVLGLVLSVVLSRRIMQPVEVLYDATRRIAGGDLSQPIRHERRDEFGVVMTTFNEMMDHLKQAQQEIAEQAYTQSQLQLAAAVQARLFRWEPVGDPRVELGHYVRTADDTGGDWAHYHLSQGRRLYVLCGDVTGHGVASAMVAAAVAGGFECLKAKLAVGDHAGQLARVMESFDAIVHAAGQGEFPMTMFAMVLDLETGEIEYVSAAHPAARVISPRASGSSVRNLITWGNFLGFEAPQTFTVHHSRIEPGDTVVVFSDGLIERRNSDGKIYGGRRLDRFLRGLPAASPEDLCDAVLADTRHYAQTDEIDDDVSLVVVKYCGAQPAAKHDERQTAS